MKDFFEALQASPTGLLPGRTDLITPFAQYTDFVGLKDYNRMEKVYLPEAKLVG